MTNRQHNRPASAAAYCPILSEFQEIFLSDLKKATDQNLFLILPVVDALQTNRETLPVQ